MKNKKKPSVLLISIDAVQIDLALNPNKYGVELPTISGFLKEGTYTTEGVSPVFPSYTFCCHQSIITGTHPNIHGLYTNKLFDPVGAHMDAWNWYVSDNVPTLWSYAKNNGYLSANIGFPSSVLAETDYNIPSYWRDNTDADSKVLDAASVPQGLAKEAESVVGRIRCGLADIKDDYTKLNACLWLLDNKIKPHLEEKPFFMTTYFWSYDDLAHNVGTFNEKPLQNLEKIDGYLGKLIDKAVSITDGNIIICVISDHGMLDNISDVRPNAVFNQEGLIQIDEHGNVKDWKAWSARSGGAAYIKLKNSKDLELKEKVREILNNLSKEYPSVVDEIMTGEEASAKRHGFPDADFILTTQAGYEVREEFQGDFVPNSLSQKATHGFAENLKSMQAMFLLKGAGIEKGKKLGGFSVIDIAPTLANLMGFEMPTAQGKNIL